MSELLLLVRLIRLIRFLSSRYTTWLEIKRVSWMITCSCVSCWLIHPLIFLLCGCSSLPVEDRSDESSSSQYGTSVYLYRVMLYGYSPDRILLSSGKFPPNNRGNNKSTHHHNHTNSRYQCYSPHYEKLISVCNGW